MDINYKDFNKSWMNLDKNLNRYFKQKKLKLNKLDFRILNILKENEYISANEIAKSLDLSRPRITVSINELSNKGFIEINKDKNDKRKYNINITNKGDEYLSKQYKFFNDFFEKIWNNFDEIEKLELLKLIDKTNSIVVKTIKEDENEHI
ncbi:MAG: MarR family winged helix-turn-helix transcriptional regulator [Streptobacillus sp.]